MLDYDLLSRELVRALRGDRSQRALSRRLRYESNVVYLWESGRRWPTAAGLFWLAHRTGVDVPHVVRRILPERKGQEDIEAWTVPGAAEFLVALAGDRSAAALARDLGVSRHSVARWLRGETEPRLPVVLRLVHLCTSRLLHFLSQLVDPAGLPSVADEWARQEAARRLVAEAPWAPAFMVALDLDVYKARPHQPGWIAHRLGLAHEEEERCLSLLQQAGHIVWREGRWETVPVEAIDASSPARRTEIKQWWAQVSVDRLGDSTDSLYSWNLFTVTEADLGRIKELQRQYFRGLREIVRNAEGSERVVLASLHLAVLDGARAPR